MPIPLRRKHAAAQIIQPIAPGILRFKKQAQADGHREMHAKKYHKTL
jgi:hypothetical protein